MVAKILDATAQSFLSRAFGYRTEPVARYGEDFPAGFVVIEWLHTNEINSQVALLGDMLPKVPFTTVGKQHIAKEYYPGNPEPSVQVLGSREEPVTIKGEFKTIRYKDEEVKGDLATGRLRDAAAEMAKHFDEVRKRGNLLQLTLGDWERWGYLVQATFNMKTRQLIEYELQFEIIGDTAPENAKLLGDTAQTSESANTELLAAAEGLQPLLEGVPPTMPQDLFDVLNAAVSALSAKLALVTGFVSASIGSAEDARRLAEKGLGLVKGAQAAVSSYQRRVGALNAYASEPKTLSVSLPPQQAKLKNQKYINEAALTAAKRQKAADGSVLQPRSIAEILADMRSSFSALARTVPLFRHLVVDGDTLQKLSVKYYDNADNAMRIYEHNKLTTTALVSGTVLEIPKL